MNKIYVYDITRNIFNTYDRALRSFFYFLSFGISQPLPHISGCRWPVEGCEVE